MTAQQLTRLRRQAAQGESINREDALQILASLPSFSDKRKSLPDPPTGRQKEGAEGTPGKEWKKQQPSYNSSIADAEMPCKVKLQVATKEDPNYDRT